MTKQVIPEAGAVDAHWLVLRDGRVRCDGCDWTGANMEEYWAAHETRRTDDNIPF